MRAWHGSGGFAEVQTACSKGVNAPGCTHTHTHGLVTRPQAAGVLPVHPGRDHHHGGAPRRAAGRPAARPGAGGDRHPFRRHGPWPRRAGRRRRRQRRAGGHSELCGPCQRCGDAGARRADVAQNAVAASLRPILQPGAKVPTHCNMPVPHASLPLLPWVPPPQAPPPARSTRAWTWTRAACSCPTATRPATPATPHSTSRTSGAAPAPRALCCLACTLSGRLVLQPLACQLCR